MNASSDLTDKCETYYNECIEQENAADCGIPLLNISVSCHVDEEQQCKKDSCVSAVGNFFFGNNGEFRFTRQVFECCEHSDSCFGYPGHVYSPWNCLEKDPFYSCNRVQNECLNDNASSSRECGENYQRVLRECPTALYDTDYDDVTLCPEQISQECRDAMASIEGWYCSCRSELDIASSSTRPIVKGSDEYTQCMKNQRIFTHNKCLADFSRDNAQNLNEQEFVVNSELSYATTSIWGNKTPLIWLGGSLLFVSLLLIIFRLAKSKTCCRPFRYCIKNKLRQQPSPPVLNNQLKQMNLDHKNGEPNYTLRCSGYLQNQVPSEQTIDHSLDMERYDSTKPVQFDNEFDLTTVHPLAPKYGTHRHSDDTQSTLLPDVVNYDHYPVNINDL